jgi:very-short-patch-repair endonuclease
LTEDGHKVRSRAEQMIDNWLYHQGIVHAYERKAPIEDDLYCDFYIPKGKVWIEYWGLEDEKYIKRKEAKKKIYKKNGMKLIELNDKDIEKLDDVMPAKLREFFPSEHCFD